MEKLFEKPNLVRGQALTPKNFGVTWRSQGGQAVAIAVVFFLAISITVIIGIAGPILTDSYLGRNLERSKDTYFLAEALAEDIVYRLRAGKIVSSNEALTLLGNTASATVSDVSGGKQIISTGDIDSTIRRVQVDLILGTGASFNFGVQTDVGGIVMENNSSVLGNVFSNGTVEGQNSNLVKGSAISAGSPGLIDGVHATGTAYAHTIRDSEIEKDAYYQVISGTTVLGTSFPGSPDQATTTLPISDEQINAWKAEASAGGTTTCSGIYEFTSASTTGPRVYTCDVKIHGTNFDVNLSGPVLVQGDITIENSPTIKVAPSLGASSVVLIADDESDRLNKGKIALKNSTEFEGGSGNSYILVISNNNSAENGGTVKAIEIENSATGDVLLYSGHGEVVIKNSVSLKEVTAYRVRLQNFAEVVYESGLVNLLFTSGPGGSYDITRWREVE